MLAKSQSQQVYKVTPVNGTYEQKIIVYHSPKFLPAPSCIQKKCKHTTTVANSRFQMLLQIENFSL